jgi:hypothetical protein
VNAASFLPSSQELDVPWDTASLPPASAAAAPRAPAAPAAQGAPTAEQLLGVYAALQQQHGFRGEQVEAALSALPLGGLSVEAALDWLLLHLQPAELPRRYASQARSGAGGAVDVKHVAREAPAEERQTAAAAGAAAEQERAALEQRRAAEAQRAAEAERAAEEQRAREEQQRRAWILQYMEVRDACTALPQTRCSEMEEMLSRDGAAADASPPHQPSLPGDGPLCRTRAARRRAAARWSARCGRAPSPCGATPTEPAWPHTVAEPPLSA